MTMIGWFFVGNMLLTAFAVSLAVAAWLRVVDLMRHVRLTVGCYEGLVARHETTLTEIVEWIDRVYPADDTETPTDVVATQPWLPTVEPEPEWPLEVPADVVRQAVEHPAGRHAVPDGMSSGWFTPTEIIPITEGHAQ